MGKRRHLLPSAPLDLPLRLQRAPQRDAHLVHCLQHVIDLRHVAMLHGCVEVLPPDSLRGTNEWLHHAREHAARPYGDASDQRHQWRTHAPEQETLRVGKGISPPLVRPLRYEVVAEHADLVTRQGEAIVQP